jgi:poly-gamma-glutamate capsule biosynthesis protein CapA/YwtB (metallophosphatase superfamily)
MRIKHNIFTPLIIILIAASNIAGYGQITAPANKIIITVPNEKITALPLQPYDTVMLAFIGDVMQHGVQVKKALKKGHNPAMQSSYDYSTAFKYLSKTLSGADLATANMEFPVGDYPFGQYPNFKAPVAIAKEAKKSGIDLFLLANNHMADQGTEGFIKSLNIYDSLGMKYTGAYKSFNESQEKAPAIFELKGIKIAIINFCYGLNCSLEGSATVSLMDSTTIKSEIMRAKERNADIIVATPHWGTEYHLFPSKSQKKWAEMLFRNGVHIVIGTHPHVPQTWEIQNNKYNARLVDRVIFYSLGNFISNQSNPDYTQLELLAEIPIVRNNLTGEIAIGIPKHTFLWCFKAGEMENNYTVVPVKFLKGKKHLVRNKEQYERMMKTYNYVILQFNNSIK